MTVINDFIFSLNTVLPVFILVMVGWYIRHRGTVDESFIGAVSNVVFYYALPAGIFMDVATTDLHELVNPRFVAVTMLGTAGVFFTAWFVISRIYHDGREVAAAVHSAYRGNYIYIGVPIIQNILQTTTLTCSVLVITFVLSLYNVLAVLILSVYSGDMSQLNFKHLALTLLKNPMIIATLLGIAYALTGLPLTPVAAKSLGYLKVIASPLALLMIGMRMVGNSAKGKGGLIRLALLLRHSLRHERLYHDKEHGRGRRNGGQHHRKLSPSVHPDHDGGDFPAEDGGYRLNFPRRAGARGRTGPRENINRS